MSNSRRNHWFLIIVLLLLSALNINLLIEVKNNKQIISSISDNHITKTDLLLNTLYFQLESENTKLDGNIEVTSESGLEAKLEDLVSPGPKLFLRYSDLDCDMCIDHSLEYLNSIADSIGHKNIIILASYGTMRELSVFKRINKIDFPVYRLPENGLGIPIEYYGIPYLFIANETLRAENLHILNKDIEDMSDLFLSVIPPKFNDVPKE